MRNQLLLFCPATRFEQLMEDPASTDLELAQAWHNLQAVAPPHLLLELEYCMVETMNLYRWRTILALADNLADMDRHGSSDHLPAA